MLGRGVKVNMQLRSIAFHNTAAFSFFFLSFLSYSAHRRTKLRVDKKKEKKEEEKRNTIIPTIALKIVWKESKLPNCCIWDQKMFEIPKILFFLY